MTSNEYGRPRTPETVTKMLELLGNIWTKCPNLRLGQLLSNAVPGFEKNPFNTEDSVIMENLRKFPPNSGV